MDLVGTLRLIFETTMTESFLFYVIVHSPQPQNLLENGNLDLLGQPQDASDAL